MVYIENKRIQFSQQSLGNRDYIRLSVTFCKRCCYCCCNNNRWGPKKPKHIACFIPFTISIGFSLPHNNSRKIVELQQCLVVISLVWHQTTLEPNKNTLHTDRRDREKQKKKKLPTMKEKNKIHV